MKKNKLYKVTKYNRLAFMPYEEYGNQYTIGGMISGLGDKLGGALGNKLSLDSPTGSLVSAAGSLVGSLGNKAISGGYSSGAANAIGSIGGKVGGLISNVNPVLGGIVSAGSGIVAGIGNRLFGSKTDEELLAKIQQGITYGNNFRSNAGTFEELKGPEAFVTNTNVYKGGLLRDMSGKNRELAEQLYAAKSFADRSVENNRNNIWDDMVNDALFNYSAYGGPLNTYGGALGLMQNDKYIDAINNRSDAMANKNNIQIAPQSYFEDGGGLHIKKKNRGKFTAQAKRAGMGVQEYASHVLAHKEDYPATTVKRANFAHVFGGRNYAFGGELGTNGTDWTNGLLYIDEGGTHQQNPLGGVPVGFDQNGTPNLVEEGETIWNDYVFSDRMKVPKAMFHTLGLGGAAKGISFADASKKLSKESEQRPNDPISMAGLEMSLSKLAAVQEAERMKKQAREEHKFAYGGKKGNMFVGEGGKPNRLQKLRYSYIGAQFPTLQDAENIYEYNHRFNPWYLGLDVKMEDVPSGLTGYTRRRPVIRAEQPDYIMPTTGPSMQEMEGVPVQNIKRDYPLGVAMPFVPKVNNTTSDNTSVQLPQQGANTVQDIPEEDIVQWYEDQGLTREAAQEAAAKDLAAGNNSKAQRNQASNVQGTRRNRSTGFARDRAFAPSLDDMYNNTYEFAPSNSTEFIPFTGMSEAEVRGIENDPRFTAWTDYVNNNWGNAESGDWNDNIIPYLKWLDAQTGGHHLFDTEGNLLPEAQDYFNRARTQNHLMGYYHLTPEDWGNNAGANPEEAPLGVQMPGTPAPEATTPATPVDAAEANNNADNEIAAANLKRNLEAKIPKYDTWMRYAPIAGSAIGVFGDLLGLTNRPDYSSADRLEAAANAAGYAPQVGYKPVGDYMRYTPFDRMFYANQLQGNARATDRMLANTSAPSRAAGLLANAYNTNNALGNLYRQGDEYNLAQYQQSKNFNRGTNMANSQMSLEAAIANARYNQAAKSYQMEGLARAAALRDSIDARIGAARSANLSNFYNNLGNLGRENFIFNQINSDRSRNYKTDNTGWADYISNYIDEQLRSRSIASKAQKAEGESAYGGKLKRNKR